LFVKTFSQKYSKNHFQNMGDEARCLGARRAPRMVASPSRPAMPDSPPDCRIWIFEPSSPCDIKIKTIQMDGLSDCRNNQFCLMQK